jgi:ATP-binding cassette subfamily E protein 1
MKICPKVRTGSETIIVDPEKSNKVIIQEDLCSGCGICVKKCPFEAITIINLPEEIREPVHQYGINGFRLYNLPSPREDGVVGILGKNGIGKTTLLRILAGEIKPNLGILEEEGKKNAPNWKEIIEKFRGREIQSYLKKLSHGKIKAVYKPQFVDLIPRYVKGKVNEILERMDEKGSFEEIVEKLNLKNSLKKNIGELSGGELQKVAIASTLLKDGDVYLIDEPSAYLDVEERLNVAKVIRNIKEKVFVVEHDLVVLDYLSDYVHILYGSSGAYGILSNIKGVRVGINEYLQGFLKAERMRFRDEEIKFEITEKKKKKMEEKKELCSYPRLKKSYPEFSLDISPGELRQEEILGILGPNAIGKTTFVKLLAGVTTLNNIDNKKLDLGLSVSYKPQYIKPSHNLVSSLKLKPELVEKFKLRFFMNKRIDELSGGELQKVAIADCLSKEADIYLLDEPSAYLDVEERLKFSKYMKKFSEENEKTAILIVDHDLLLIDTLSNRIMVFSGESGKYGKASKPMSLRKGLNTFLKSLGITFRRDPETGRPRANKIGSVKDREQKERGEYYYVR